MAPGTASLPLRLAAGYSIVRESLPVEQVSPASGGGEGWSQKRRPLGPPWERLTETWHRGRERDDKKPIGNERGSHPPMAGGHRMPWKTRQRKVCKRQKRLSRASRRAA